MVIGGVVRDPARNPFPGCSHGVKRGLWNCSVCKRRAKGVQKGSEHLGGKMYPVKEMPTSKEGWISMREALNHMGICRRTLTNWQKKYKLELPFVYLGRPRTTRAMLDAWIIEIERAQRRKKGELQ